MQPTFRIDRQESQFSGESAVLRKTISSQHFGGNLLITNAQDHELAVDRGLGQSLRDVGISNLRYPGGTVTEYDFDMTDPDCRGTDDRPLIWQSQFLRFASDIGASVTMVIPTRCAFTMDAASALGAGQYGARTVSRDYVNDVRKYVFDTIVAAAQQGIPVRIQAFEIGNEFWASGEMTATEYGRVAAAVLHAATSAINAAIRAGYLDAADRPSLVVQSVSAAGYMSPSSANTAYVSDGQVYKRLAEVPDGQAYEVRGIDAQGNARAQLRDIVGELQAANAGSLVDGIVDHYYNAQGYAGVDTGEQFMFNQFDFMEQQLGRTVGSLERYVTEWNTKRIVNTGGSGSDNNAEAAQNRGLPQAGMLVEMFYEMVTHGVDSANIWPLWFPSGNNTSLLDNRTFTARVPAAIFDLMQESLVGTIPLFDQETTSGSFMLDTHGFESRKGMVLFSQNRSAATLASFSFDLDRIPSAELAHRLDTQPYFLVFTELAATLDGVAHSGANGEEVTPEVTWSNGRMQSGDRVSYVPDRNDLNRGLDPSAILRTEITFITSGADEIFGRGGHDEIRAGAGNDRLFGGDGNDRLAGEAGNDMLDGGTGNDSLFGGAGSDKLYGGEGNDMLDGGAGADRLAGGAGIDTASYASAAAAVRVEFANVALNTGDAAGDTYSSVENIVGSRFNDILGGNNLANRIEGGNGNDSIRGLGGNDSLYGNAGDDTLLGGLGADRLFGGAGFDFASYSAATTGVRADLRNVAGYNTGEAAGDTYSQIEGLIGSNHADVLRGDALANMLLGNNGNDSLYGGAGNDTLDGGAGADRLEGGSGIDTASYASAAAAVRVEFANAALNTGDAAGDAYSSVENILGSRFNDILGGNDLANRIDGGNGNDSIRGLGGNDSIFGGTGRDTIRGGSHSDWIEGGESDDMLYGDGSSDTIRGDDGNDLIDGGGSADLLYGGAGSDTIDGGSHNDRIYGGADSDSLTGGTGNDRIYGGGSADTIFGGVGNDTIDGGSNNDVIHGGDGDDSLIGGTGRDTIYGGSHNDWIDGGESHDVLYGDGSSDTIHGGDGNDLIDGGGSADLLYGGAGNDTIDGGSHNDRIYGGADSDSLTGGTGNDRLYGGAHTDWLSGGAGDDLLDGGSGSDTLYGGAGDDMLIGGSSNDRLFGGSGRDTLHGGTGGDRLTGGDGADVFVFRAGDARDAILDFSLAEDDMLRLDPALWTGTLTARQVVSAFASVSGGNVQFTFAGGDQLTLEGIGTVTGLAAQIEIW